MQEIFEGNILSDKKPFQILNLMQHETYIHTDMMPLCKYV